MKGSQKPRDQISPERLMEAAEAVLRAIDEVQTVTGKPCPYPTLLMGSENQPQALCDFTKPEVEEACAFLMRLGVLVAK